MSETKSTDVNKLHNQVKQLQVEVEYLQMQKDILEKPGEIIKKTKASFWKHSQIRKKFSGLMPSEQNISYLKYFQSLVFPKVVMVIIRNNLLCLINIKIYARKLLVYLKKINADTDIAEYMQHLKALEPYYWKDCSSNYEKRAYLMSKTIKMKSIIHIRVK